MFDHKIRNAGYALCVAVGLTGPVFAQAAPADAVQPTMPTPMMGYPQGGMPMMGQPQGHMPMMRGRQQMPMMGHRQHAMPMHNQQPGKGSRHGCRHGGEAMHGGGQDKKQMRHQRQAQMLEHMKKMEAHMANIEALLQQMIDMQNR